MMKPTDIIHQLPLAKGVQLLKVHSSGLFALEKPAGVLSHPNKTEEVKKSLLIANYDLENEFFDCVTQDNSIQKVFFPKNDDPL